MPTSRRPRLRPSTQIAQRALYSRTNADLMVNDPPGFPSAFPPVHWMGSDTIFSGTLGSYQPPTGPWGQGMAEAVSAVSRATSLLVDPISQSPLTVQESGPAGAPLGTPRWLSDPMLVRPDQRIGEQVYPAVLRLPRSKFWGDFVRSALWWGLGAFVCQEDETGQPIAGTLKLVHPGFLATERADDNSLRWVLGSNDDRIVADRDGYFTVGATRWRIVVLRNPASPVDTEGGSQGVFALNPSAFRLAGRLSSYSEGVFQSGVPSGYLKVGIPGITQPQVDELRRAWAIAHEASSTRRTAVLNSTTEYVPISMSPVDTALAQVKQLSTVDVAYAFGIAPEMLGASMGASLTYSNMRDWFRQHRDFGLGIWISALQDVLSALLPGTQGVKVDTDAFTRPEAKDRYESYTVALEAGILTLDEVRELEGLPPLPEPGPSLGESPAPAPVPDPQVEPGPEPATVRSLPRTQSWRR